MRLRLNQNLGLRGLGPGWVVMSLRLILRKRRITKALGRQMRLEGEIAAPWPWTK